MSKTNQKYKYTLRLGSALLAFALLAVLHIGCTPNEDKKTGNNSTKPILNSESLENKKAPSDGVKMTIHYLEVVTPDVNAFCDQYSAIHGITFSEPDANLGGARTAKLNGGGRIGVRKPLRETETPVVRPYALVDDIQEAVATATDTGAEIAIPSMEIPGHGTIAVIIQGGIEYGLWQTGNRP
ncbi:MAG: hypothetical protein MPJ24_05445 [Pirellulaceae bacterium]|nr:hypothetical protein [Pirellulaceae bacterium]